MTDEDNKGPLNVEKIKILSILPNHQELQGDIFLVKIYSSDVDGKDWLYSGLEGYLALIVDYSIKTKYLYVFDTTNYQKVFQYELYKGFEKCFEELAPDFRCFEIETGFIGLKFDTDEEAVNFEMILKKITSMKNIFNKPIIKEDQKELKNKKELAMNYAKILKENFVEKGNKYNENYAEDGIEISKHRNFKILNNISYDKGSKKFKFSGKISEELKEWFMSFGIKKKYLENDLDLAFTLFKNVIIGLGKENKLKNISLDNIAHTFLPPNELEQLRRQEELAEAKLNAKRNEKIKNRNKEKGAKNKPVSEKRGSAPLIPPPPPLLAIPVKIVPRQPKKSVCIPSNQESVIDKQTEIQNIKLKPIKYKDEKEDKDKKQEDNGLNILQKRLKDAIINRYEIIHQFDDDNSEKSDDDW
jgi:hypothetical protein